MPFRRPRKLAATPVSPSHTSMDREEGELSDGEITDSTLMASQTAGRSLSVSRGRRNGQSKAQKRGTILSQKKTSKHNTVLESYRLASSTSASATMTNRNQHPAGDKPQQTRTNGSESVEHKNFARPSLPNSKPYRFNPPGENQPPREVDHSQSSTQRQRARRFILALHQHNYSFEQIVAEGLDPIILGSIFDELHIVSNKQGHHPIESTVNAPSHDMNLAAKSEPDKGATKSVSESLRNSLTHTATQFASNKPDKPILDRQDYAARLMAAKSKKPEVGINQKHDLQTGETSRGGSLSNGVVHSPESLDVKTAQERRKAQTELARLRMEALQSKRTTNPNISNKSLQPMPEHANTIPDDSKPESPSQANPPLDKSGPSSIGRIEQANKSLLPSQQPLQLDAEVIHPSPSNKQTNKANGLVQIPGLFPSHSHSPPMESKSAGSAKSQSPDNDPLSAPTLLSNMRKRPVAADFDDTSFKIAKRTFGQPRDHGEVEDIIIEASEDERTDSDVMQEYAEENPLLHQNPALSLLRDSAITNADASPRHYADDTISSNGDSGKSSIQQAMDLELREKRINLMKRKIAKMEERRKAKSLQSEVPTPTSTGQCGSAAMSRQESDDRASSRNKSDAEQSGGHTNDESRQTVMSIISTEQEAITRPPDSETQSIVEMNSQSDKISIQPRSSPKHAILEHSQPTSETSILIPQDEHKQGSTDEDLHPVSLHVSNEENEDHAATCDEGNGAELIEQRNISQSFEQPETKANLDDRKSFIIAEDILPAEELSDDSATSMSISVQDMESTSSLKGTDGDGVMTNVFEKQDSFRNTRQEDEQALAASEALNQIESVATITPSSAVRDQNEREAFEGDSSVHHNLQKQMHHKATDVAAQTVLTQISEVSRTSRDEDTQMDGLSGSNINLNGATSDSESGLDEAIFDLANAETDNENHSVSNDAKSTPSTPQSVDEDASFLMSDEEYGPPDAANESSGEQEDMQLDDDDYEPPDISSLPGVQPEDTTQTWLQPASGLSPAASQRESSLTEVVRSDPTAPDNSLTEKQEEGSALFIPYESPLKIFKAFRNHPNFLQLVPGGFRSTTYSHSIDPNQPLCQFEAAGGTCNDNKCLSQHFRTMPVADDAILLQLGNRNPGRTEVEVAKWSEGLREVIQTLQSRRITDSEVVATEILAYRRRFLNDPSRILDL